MRRGRKPPIGVTFCHPAPSSLRQTWGPLVEPLLQFGSSQTQVKVAA